MHATPLTSTTPHATATPPPGPLPTAASEPPLTLADVESLRAAFPVLQQTVNKHPLVYLDNAATTQKPQAVIDALVSVYTDYNSNIHRGVHALSQRATDAFETAREKARAFINAPSHDEIVFVRGCTEAINLVAHSYARPQLKPGDEVLITELEHHANIVPWQFACETTGATLRVAPVADDGSLDLEAFARLLSPRTRIAAFTHVSNAFGTVLPVKQLVEMAHAVGAITLVDAAQSAPHMPLDVQALGCDFLTFSGHKVYAPTGIGILYGRYDLLAAMPPWQGGGSMVDTVTFERTTYEVPPLRFEAGTPAIAEAIALGAAIDYVTAIGLTRLAAWEHALLDTATRGARDIPGIRVLGNGPNRTSVLAFTMQGVHPFDLGMILDQYGVAIRTGHHCAQPLLRRFGLTASARASFAFYNTPRDVETFLVALDTARELAA